MNRSEVFAKRQLESFFKSRVNFGRFLLSIINSNSPEVDIRKLLQTLDTSFNYNKIPVINFCEYAGILQTYIKEFLEALYTDKKTEKSEGIGQLLNFCKNPHPHIENTFKEYHRLFSLFIGLIMKYMAIHFLINDTPPLDRCVKCGKLFIKTVKDKKLCSPECEAEIQNKTR
ncbi:MAG: hypothetical protein J6Y02_04450 [Pseudobutyrivibrio sp.]|nr:hypothetical protein [Pseudobutyrivibrio sp.]